MTESYVGKEAAPLCCVAGMPRTGTTWLARMLADAFKVPSLSRHWHFDTPKARKADSAIYAIRRKGRPVRRGHWSAKTYPFTDSPVAVTVRDPRDMAVSSYYYYEQEDLHAHALWLVGEEGEKWNNYLADWFMTQAPFVRYERLKEDPLAELTRIIPLLELELPSVAHLRKVVRDNDFATMEKRGKKHVLMRRGIVGEWREIMEPTTAALIEERCGELMGVFGYV